MWNWSRRCWEGEDKKVTKSEEARGLVLSHSEMKMALLLQLLFSLRTIILNNSWYVSYFCFCVWIYSICIFGTVEQSVREIRKVKQKMWKSYCNWLQISSTFFLNAWACEKKENKLFHLLKKKMATLNLNDLTHNRSLTFELKHIACIK